MMNIERQTTQRRLGSRGLTLIEVVAALGIIAIGIVGILALFPTGLKQAGEAGDRTTAAILGEYVIEQVRLRQNEVLDTDDTGQALTHLDWGNYTYAPGGGSNVDYTFDATANLGASEAYGSGEQIIWQRTQPNNPYDPADPAKPTNGLSDSQLYSRYEVTLEFDKIIKGISSGNPVYNDAFTTGGKTELMQVTVTVRWPRARTDAERIAQNTMTFVTFIRPQGT